MKADKTFYNTLRAEVQQGEVKHTLSLFMWSHKNKLKEALKATQQTFDEAVIQGKDDDIQELKEKIEGLQSQVTLLEKRNQELTEKNKELEARAYPEYTYEELCITDEEIDEMIRQQEEFEADRAACYRRGYISLKEIAKWGNEGTENIAEARLIKEMIRDIMPVQTEEERELVKNIGSAYKLFTKQIPHVGGDYVLNKTVQHEVNNVQAGGTGFKITRETE